jgi:nicotinamide-nucleotide adenylyltransferase
MKKTGVILARLQPIHNGHLELIKKSMKENDETIIFVGSADKFNGRNPIPINLRMQMAHEAIEEMRDNEKIYTYYRLVPLDDLSDESDNSHDWGFYLFSNETNL